MNICRSFSIIHIPWDSCNHVAYTFTCSSLTYTQYRCFLLGSRRYLRFKFLWFDTKKTYMEQTQKGQSICKRKQKNVRSDYERDQSTKNSSLNLKLLKRPKQSSRLIREKNGRIAILRNTAYRLLQCPTNYLFKTSTSCGVPSSVYSIRSLRSL